MPTLREAIYSLLTGDPALVGLVPGGFYSENLPADYGVPCALFTSIGGVLDIVLDGTFTGLVESRVQFDIYANVDDQASIEAIRKRLIQVLNLNHTDVVTPSGSFEILQMDPINFGQYLPEDPTRRLRYSIDFDVQFGDC